MEISVGVIVYFAVSILLIIEGIYAIVKGKPLNFSSSPNKSADKYDPKSYKTANKVFGVFTALAGLVFLVNQLCRVLGWYKSLLPSLIALGIFIIGVVIYYIILKKKTNSSGGKHHSGNIRGYGDD